jgi:hypothetical protein
VLAGVWPGALPADAQAVPVTIRVATRPPTPKALSDVIVRIRIGHCPPGEVTTEVFLTADDGVTRSSTLVATEPAVTSLWFRATARPQLRRAAAGTYGVRVACGEFRPPRGPIMNTTFRVGTGTDTTARLSAPSVAPGAALTLTGGACAGARVDYEVALPTLTASGFQASGSIPTAADGTWSGPVQFPATLRPGPVEVEARCVVEGLDGTSVAVRYDRLPTVTVEGGAASTSGG